MKIIDAHMHYSNIASFYDCARRTAEVDYSEAGYAAEAEACGIVRSVCMGLAETPPSVFPDAGARTPMLANLSYSLPPGITLCAGINPYTLTDDSIEEIERLIYSGSISGIKIYAGYYHFDVNDPVYRPVYTLAEKHNLAVAIHSGDTYSEKGKLIYAQPLSIDNLAVDRPDLKIVICHMGAPWIYDGCEVAGKNKNVYMDLSGLHIGNAAYFSARIQNTLLIDRYKQALTIMDDYDKVLFGTDWPLAPMASYIDFCKKLVPPESYDKVFYENALRVYNLGAIDVCNAETVEPVCNLETVEP